MEGVGEDPYLVSQIGFVGLQNELLEAIKKVSFTITSESLKFFTSNMTWEVERSDFKVFVGRDSQATLSEAFKVVQ